VSLSAAGGLRGKGKARRSTVSDRAKLSNGGPGSSKANVMTLNLVPLMLVFSFLTPGVGQGTKSGQAKPPTPAKTEQQPPPTVTPPSSGTPASYAIGLQDVLKITVFDEPELSGQSYRVDSDGMITFWLLGRVSAVGLTLRQFQDRLKEQLANGYIKNPQVRVEIEQYKSQSIYVFGEVRQPGRISMMERKSLLEALAEAGSPTSQASTEITITHARRSNGTTPTPDSLPEGEKTVIDLRDLQAAQQYLLSDGDIVTVPKAQTFFIGGEVRNNGPYVWLRGITLAQAVTLAGGLTDRGTFRGASATRLVNGKPVEIKLDELDKVVPGDTIRINKRLF
jgi:polysaccharide export outer membrane protein